MPGANDMATIDRLRAKAKRLGLKLDQDGGIVINITGKEFPTNRLGFCNTDRIEGFLTLLELCRIGGDGATRDSWREFVRR